jgi:hypothetical protein
MNGWYPISKHKDLSMYLKKIEKSLTTILDSDFTNLDLFWGLLSCHITSIVPVTPSMKSSRHKYSVTSRSCCSSSCGWAVAGHRWNLGAMTSMSLVSPCYVQVYTYVRYVLWNGISPDISLAMPGMGLNEQPSVEWAP